MIQVRVTDGHVLYFKRVETFRKILAAGLITFSFAAAAPTPKPVDAVLDDYAKALGGLGAVEAITSRKIIANMRSLGKAELYWQSPNKVLLLAAGARTGYDGATGFYYSKRKRLRRLQQGQQMPLEIDGNPLRYVHMHQLYSELDAKPQQRVDDTLMDVLVAPNDLSHTTFYFDAKTHLLARIDEKGETSAYFVQTVWFEDYKPFSGVQFPCRITHQTSDKGGPYEEFKVKAIETNVAIDSEIFSKPQSTKLVLGGKR